VRQELPAIELLKAACYLPAEPYIVIEIVLHELLHVFVGAASDIRGNTVELRLHCAAGRQTYILSQK
jgi:hypothetical protein